MVTISIDIDTSKGEIYLYGGIAQLCKNRFALRYIKDYLRPVIESEKITIPIKDKDVITVLSDIRDMLLKYGFNETHSVSSEQILLDFYEEERKFMDFSQKALSIRNNHCDPTDFSSFTNVVASNLVNRSFYDLQLLSAYHMAFSQNACNFSVPGAGKTSIVYGAYVYLKNLSEENQKKVDCLLIVGPLSSFGPWETEYVECFGKLPQVKRLVSGLSRDEKMSYLYSSHPAELTLISYATLCSMREDIISFLRRNKVMVVLDEAHKAKNTTGGSTAQTVLEIAKYCKARVVLTGTPAPNGYEDLYNLFTFIWPSKNVIGFAVNQLRDMSDRLSDVRVNRLVENVSPFFIRIKKSDLNIPPATVHDPIYVNMGPIQQRIYDFIEKRYVDSMLQNSNVNSVSRFKEILIRAKAIRLMQAATNPSMLKLPLQEFLGCEDCPKEVYRAVDDTDVLQEIFRYETLETPVKFNVAKNLVDQITQKNGKVIVWAIFINTIYALKNYFSKFGIISQELYGAIPVERDGIEEEEDSDEVILTRERIIKDFHKDDCPYKVLIANPSTVSESISLHKTCHHAIYVERSFNAAHFVQSKDRIHRYGLTYNDETHYYFIVSKNSIDETIDSRLNEKERRMTEITESMPIPLFDNVTSDMGDEDIKALIRDYVRRTKKS